MEVGGTSSKLVNPIDILNKSSKCGFSSCHTAHTAAVILCTTHSRFCIVGAYCVDCTLHCVLPYSCSDGTYLEHCIIIAPFRDFAPIINAEALLCGVVVSCDVAGERGYQC